MSIDNAQLKLDEFKAQLPQFKETLHTIRRSL